ncbi:hypothetical protein Tco_0163364 [Tanacetum coccineum]
MLNKKLQTEYWNEMCYQLLKLMTKQMDRTSRFKGRIVRIKSLLMLLEVNIAKVRVTAVKHQCFSAAGTKVNAAGIKVTTAERLQLLGEFLLTEG